MATLAPIVCIEHQATLVRPLDSGRVPLFIPRVLRPVVKGFSRTVGTKTHTVREKEVSLDCQHVSIGR